MAAGASDDHLALRELEAAPMGLPAGLEHDDFFAPLGSELELVRGAKIAELPGEIGAVSRDARIAALRRIDEPAAPRLAAG